MRSRQILSGRPIALAVALLALAAQLPARAQDDAGHSGSDEPRPSTPAPNHPSSDEPPSLDLGSPSKQSQPDRSEPDTKPGRWRPYAEAVHNALQAALDANSKTRLAQANVEFEMWIDPKGRVTRVQLVGPTGDTALDAAFREVLSKLTLPEPARDMPMPVKGRINGSRRSDG